MTHKKDCDTFWLPVACDCLEQLSPNEQLAKSILEFECPECAEMDKCIDSLECRLYAQGRKDAAAIALGQQSTPIVIDEAKTK